MKIKKGFIKKYSVIFLLVLMLAVGGILSDKFLTFRNLLNVLRQVAVLGCVTIGMSFVVLSGCMDLSIGAILSFTGLIVISFQGFFSPGLSILFALAFGLVIGLANGLIIIAFHANSGDSLMITFGTQMIISGISLIYTKGFSLSGSSSQFFNEIGVGNIGGIIPISALIVLIIALALGTMEQKFSFGRNIHFLGYNQKASFLSGLPVNRTKVICYAISGLMAGIGAVILSSRTLGATPTAGDGYEMDAIVALTLGGMSLSGGYGHIFNTVIGVLMLGVIGNIMNLIGFGANDQLVVKGIILIVSVVINTLSQSMTSKEA